MVRSTGHPAYTRRNMMAGLAASAAIGVTSAASAADAPADNHDELAMLIDEHREIEAWRADISEHLAELSQRADMPPWPSIKVVDVAERSLDYQPRQLDLKLGTPEDIAWFYDAWRAEVKSHQEIWPTSKWLARIDADRQRAEALLACRCAARADWDAVNGYDRLEQQENRLYERIDTLRGKICALPCRSLRDIRVKAAFALDVVALKTECEDSLIEILRSMRGAGA